MNSPLRTLHLTSDQTEIAADILRRGGLVVFPTETVYGLGANALDGAACRSVFRAKGRPVDNPLIVHFYDLDSVCAMFSPLPESARRLFDAFSPGPLSVIISKSLVASDHRIADDATAGLNTVALRIPRHPVARRILHATGFPVAAPSANLSGRPSPTTFVMACADMDGRVDAIVDGGSCDVGLESTVVDLTGPTVRILRSGAISREMLENVLGVDTVTAADSNGAHVTDNERPISPGMKYTHYKPRATVIVSEASGFRDEGDFVRRAAHSAGKGGRAAVGTIRLSGNGPESLHDRPGSISEENGVVAVFQGTAEEYARNLYRLLVWFDEIAVDVIVAELPPAAGVGMAVRDRLLRASGGIRLEPN